MNDFEKGLLVAFLRQHLTVRQKEIVREQFPELTELVALPIPSLPPGAFQKNPPQWLQDDLATLCREDQRITALKKLREWGLTFGRDTQNNPVHDLGSLIGAKRWIDSHFPG